MPKRKPQKPYKGILRMPAPKYDANLSADENMARAKEDTVKKMVALFEHYGLDLNDPKKWQRLSFQLAFDHIGTIGPSWTRPGRKPRRDDAIKPSCTANRLKPRRNELRSRIVQFPSFAGKIRVRFASAFIN
jgi:hypothetical protein